MTPKKITSRVKRTVNHVHRNRGKYAAAATAVVFVKLNMHTAREFDAFLTEKGINPAEFWLADE